MLQHDLDKPEDLDTEAEDHAADSVRYAVMSRPITAKPPAPPKPGPRTDARGVWVLTWTSCSGSTTAATFGSGCNVLGRTRVARRALGRIAITSVWSGAQDVLRAFATATSFSDRRTETPPRSSRIHPCLAHARSCLLVPSRDRPMI